MNKYVTENTDETIDLAYNLAKTLKSNDIVCLSGELGAGKTVFMAGIAKYFNIQNEVSSPTFTIVNEYDIIDKNISKLFHFDVYRLTGSDEFISSIGGLDYFSQGLCVIEWGEIIKDVLPNNTIYITITKDNENDDIRYIEINGGNYENISN